MESNALCVTCYCGLARILDVDVLHIGDKVELTPCPRCGALLRGIYTERGLEEIIEDGTDA